MLKQAKEGNSNLAPWGEDAHRAGEGPLDFQQGEFIYFNKPYGMSSFGALAFVVLVRLPSR